MTSDPSFHKASLEMQEHKIIKAGDIITLNVLTVIVFVLCLIAVVARITIRLRNKHTGLDDILMGIGMVFFTVCCAATSGCVNNGCVSDPPPPDPRRQYKARLWFFISFLSYVFTSVPVRSSLCSALLRIATTRWQKNILYVNIFGSIASAVAMTVGLFNLASPMVYYWNRNGAGEVKSPAYLANFLIMFSIFSIVENVVIGVMPVYMLWNLHKSRRQKLLLISALNLSALAIGATVARMMFLHLLNSGDPKVIRKGTSGAIQCTLLECMIAVVGGSVPALKPLIEKYLRKTRLGRTRRDSTTMYWLGTFPLPTASAVPHPTNN